MENLISAWEPLRFTPTVKEYLSMMAELKPLKSDSEAMLRKKAKRRKVINRRYKHGDPVKHREKMRILNQIDGWIQDMNSRY